MASPLISPRELAALQGAVLLDARSKTVFEAGHLRSALNADPGMHLSTVYTHLLGGLRPDHLVVHCGSGITACHTLLALEHAGLPGAALYVGSWSEWCRSGKPVALGTE